MSFTRLDQAVAERDYDLVIELATRGKREKETAELHEKMREACKNPAKVSVVVEGHNGQTLTYMVEEIPEGAVSEFELIFDRVYDEQLPDPFNVHRWAREIRPSKRRIGLKLVTQ